MNQWMKAARKNLGYSQQGLSSKTGISQQMVSAVENGARIPSVDVAKKLAGALRVQWTRFFQ